MTSAHVRTNLPPPRSLRHAMRCWLLATVLLALTACQHGDSPWQLIDISGHMPTLQFNLTDDRGQSVSAEQYRGKTVLLYFGYTHCPDICPLTLAQLHVVLDRLGPAADNTRILFVSVDPARDTPAVMHAYVNAFDRRAVGLSGSPAQLERLSKRYRSAFTREPAHTDGNYEVSHSSAIYVFDDQGRARLLATPNNTPDQLTADLRRLLAQERQS